MKTAIVCIPIYREQPTDNELLALRQAVRVLGKQPFSFIAAEGFDAAPYLAHAPKATVEYFEPAYFASVKGYNRLMLRADFYRRFQAYDYLLIYQLDAFVFRDELAHWMAQDYDYIGAPWIEAPPSPVDKRPLFNLANMMKGQVGNGGFSLRKIERFIQAAKQWGGLLRATGKNEDFLWACVLPYFMKFKRPKEAEALRFAFELSPAKAYAQNGEQLPFGCHAWEKYEPEFWAPFIQAEKDKL
ncbi:DUF5672 family protein [Saprospira grandis]|uniref:DUF5672 domain-containing protein n=1 Tax=Saprospira grandis (strain Lewin) TaxID=984262 RepID=H6KZV6_SAPGL|nr:DUF5672 family protein [Saprospira grandis]AFC25963.1 hypothetical protein SGRA_3235 [Saprospira grandis str. Lewin]